MKRSNPISCLNEVPLEGVIVSKEEYFLILFEEELFFLLLLLCSNQQLNPVKLKYIVFLFSVHQ